jgi:hypothetical protein
VKLKRVKAEAHDSVLEGVNKMDTVRGFVGQHTVSKLKVGDVISWVVSVNIEGHEPYLFRHEVEVI